MDQLTKVGWAVDMPLGRFEHVELLAECEHCLPLQSLNRGDPLFDVYQSACQRVRQLNQALLQQQRQQLIEVGWMPVDSGQLAQLDGLNFNQSDDFGSQQASAMQLLFALTANHPFVWCVEQNDRIVYVQSMQPPKEMEELERQVWKHHLLSQLSKMPGRLLIGKLLIKESGLWFCADTLPR